MAEKVKLYLAKIDEDNAEHVILEMYRNLTGREPTASEIAEVRLQLAQGDPEGQSADAEPAGRPNGRRR
jgi:hypothetical protein